MKTNTSKTAAKKRSLTNKLSAILCQEYILLTKTKNAHLSLQGTDFHDNYEFFKAQSSEIDLIIEHIEKRVRRLGNYADAMLKAFLKVMQFNKKKKKINDRAGYLTELLSDHENLITILKSNTPLLDSAFKDSKKDDFVLTLMESHEKMAWFLRSYLK
ncbi:MAG: ferritin-like domain-containing protein [Flavobacterium sp.]